MPNTTKTHQSIVLTIGHSNRSLDDFIDLLKANDVMLVADVRTIPRSSHNSQFNNETFPGVLESDRIDYVLLKRLGGLRHASRNSINTGWRNASFRGFADYMQTAEFDLGLEELLALAEESQVAIMCAEAVPWRCHRSLIADALLVRGVSVRHIISTEEPKVHALTPWAKVEGTSVTYPARTV